MKACNLVALHVSEYQDKIPRCCLTPIESLSSTPLIGGHMTNTGRVDHGQRSKWNRSIRLASLRCYSDALDLPKGGVRCALNSWRSHDKAPCTHRCSPRLLLYAAPFDDARLRVRVMWQSRERGKRWGAWQCGAARCGPATPSRFAVEVFADSARAERWEEAREIAKDAHRNGRSTS